MTTHDTITHEQAYNLLADIANELDRADDDAGLPNERLRELAAQVRAAAEAL